MKTPNTWYFVEDHNGKLVRINAEGKLPHVVLLSARTVYSMEEQRFLKSRDDYHLPDSGMTLAEWLFRRQQSLDEVPIGVCSWLLHLESGSMIADITRMQTARVTEAKTQFYCGLWTMSPFRPDLQGNLIRREEGQHWLELHWKGFDKTIQKLVAWVKEFHPEVQYVYGPPRGGLVLAVALSHHLNIKMLTFSPWKPSMREKTLWVDDIYGTGETFREARPSDPASDCSRYGAYAFWVTRDPSVKAWYGCVMRNEDWVVFPWEADDPELANADETDYLRRRNISRLGEQS